MTRTRTKVAHHQNVASHPPSTYTTCPVMNLDASDAKKMAIPSKSSGVPQRPNGARFFTQAPVFPFGVMQIAATLML